MSIIDDELEEVIHQQLQEYLNQHGCWDSEEQSARINDLIKTMNLKLEQDKFKADQKEQKRRIFAEGEKAKDEKYGRWAERAIKIIIEGGSIVIPLVFYGYFMDKGFAFEKDGVITSATFRNLFNWIKPLKR